MEMLAFGKGDGEPTNQDPAWEILAEKILRKILREILAGKSCREILCGK